MGEGITRKKPDWATVKAMFLEGESAVSLAKKFRIPASTIRNKAARHKWIPDELPARIEKKFTPVIEEKLLENMEKTWKDRAHRIREKEYQIAQRVLDFTDQLEDLDLVQRIEKIKVAAEIGRRATGLDEKQNTTNAINIAVLSDIGFLGAEVNALKGNARAIEIEPSSKEVSHECLGEIVGREPNLPFYSPAVSDTLNHGDGAPPP